MAQVTTLLFFLIFAATASTFIAQVQQCDYEMVIHTGATRGPSPTYKLKTHIEAKGGGNINTTDLVKKWGAMGKDYTYFLPNTKDRFKHHGPCMNGNFCNFLIRGKKGELKPHWYVHNVSVTTKGEGIDRVRTFNIFTEIDYLYPYLDNGECP